ncbi:type II/IV secretion system ATPase subunit [Candidatus Pacearchaeota archaeon]|nr:type II/IV secretion system ATPase subunit [Candidatus Pacearchaeota archaeon]
MEVNSMLFKQGTQVYAYEVVREAGENVMYINYLGAPYVPSIADSKEVMSRTVDAILESPNISRIVFVQQRNYNYDFSQISYLLEIAQLYTYLIKQERILSSEKLAFCSQCLGKRHDNMTYFSSLLKQDVFTAYFEVKRFLREARIELERVDARCKTCEMSYIRMLEKISALMENMRIIKDATPYFENYKPGEREIYSQFFRADIIPNFTFTRLMAVLPEDAEIVEQYDVVSGYDKSVVTILKKKNEPKYIYHLMPPEYSLDEEHHLLINLARNVLIEHRPKAEEFTDPERTRQVFFNVSRDLLQELAENKKIKLNYSDLNKLANILVRHTIGFGLIEVLLQDANLQDIVLNAPITLNPIFVRHSEFDECLTNIIPSQEDADSWASKFRMLSGRPLDEANPILDTDLGIGKIRARVAVIQQPLSPYGLAYALRRHREEPWTLPLFIKNKMLNSFSAGLLSFLIDGSRTLLVAGTRSAGKTSLLGSLMLEIMPKFRVIVLEDVLELPVDALRKLNYNILRMKVRSALLQTTTEIAADEGIRTSLRFGDSCLIIGEVRSLEARALYEAMRVGALANVVAGTIHGASPYGVFDRVVNDLQVPVTSFKATDCILVANPVKSASGLQSWRRVVQLAEVRKHWTRDPEEEGGFVDLLKYNTEKDELEPSDELINGDSEVIKSIAAGVKGWAGNWDAVYDNILLRARLKQEIVNMAEKLDIPEILEARFNSRSNSAFYEISDAVRKEIGLPVSDRVFPLWLAWMKKEVKKLGL